MKFFVFSDSHLGATRYSLKWFKDELRIAFLDMIHKAKDLNVDAILFCGDMFDYPHVPTEEIVFVIRAINYVSDLPFISIVGNHDLQLSRPLDESPLSIINEACENVTLLYNDSITTLINDINIVGISYIGPNEFIHRNPDTSVLTPYYKYLKHDTMNIALLHQDLSDLEYSKYIPNTLSSDDIKPFDFSFIGHYHNRVEAKKYLYVGSSYPLSFKQATQQKGGYLVNVDSNKLKYTFIPESSTSHKFKEFHIDFDKFEYSKVLSAIDDGYDVIRIIFRVNESKLSDASILAKQIRKDLSGKVERIIIDFDLIQNKIVHDIKFETSSIDDLIYKVLDSLKLQTKEKEQAINLVNRILNFSSNYKTESRVVDEATKVVNDLLK